MREFSVALLLTSGVLKALLMVLIPWFPDVTLISIVLLLLCMVVQKDRYADLSLTFISFLGVGFFAFFAATVLISATYSPSDVYLNKVIKFAVVLFTFLVVLPLGKIELEKVCKSFVVLSLIAALMFIYVFPKFRLGLLGEEGEILKAAYLSLGDACAVAVIMLLSILKPRLFVSLILTLLFIFTLVLSGARAPLLFLALLLFALLFIKCIKFLSESRNFSVSTVFTLTLAVTVITFLLTFKVDWSQIHNSDIFRAIEISFERLQLLFQSDKGSSVNVRIQHIETAVRLIDHNPIWGVGLGAFGVEGYGVDAFIYPHNMFLEVWVENGLLSLVSLIFIIVLVYLKLAYEEFNFGVVLILTYCLLNSMKSSSYVDNRVLFFWLAFTLFNMCSPKPSKVDYYGEENTNNKIGTSS